LSHNFLIAGGGTGGHLFPGIALAQELVRRSGDNRVLFVGTARGIETTAVPRAGFELALLPVTGLRRKGVLGLIAGLARLPVALWQAFSLVRRFRPSVAVSVGGYAAGPAVLAARLTGVPCVVMEQNAVAGLTNRMLGTIAAHVVVPLPTTAFGKHKVRVLGNPVRQDLLPVREAGYAPHDPVRVLVFGGSLGAKALNDAMIAAAPRLATFTPAVKVVHQTGSADFARVAAAYEAAGVTAVSAQAFIHDMATAYREADLVVSRAGATTVAELTVCGRPSILVPYPFAVDDHQTAHARQLEAGGAAVHLPQTELSVERLLSLLAELAGDRQRLERMAAAARALGKPDAAARIADLVGTEARRVS
jgi:UDP-N-acetylglucosamine--N-acetylmuramyl-(pentapeptide) pyrophosphoryl-undecaprenol N-acetylglucosamine transferase